MKYIVTRNGKSFVRFADKLSATNYMSYFLAHAFGSSYAVERIAGS